MIVWKFSDQDGILDIGEISPAISRELAKKVLKTTEPEELLLINRADAEGEGQETCKTELMPGDALVAAVAAGARVLLSGPTENAEIW